ncbi:MAG: TIGR00341 family protein [Chloroflexota bacterium]|nr:MAG: TIGR00341 family protein [Chloroflexota bacterium]
MDSQEKAAPSSTDLPADIGLILVPIIQPKYSRELIDLALDMAASEEATVLVLLVSLGNVEEDAETIQAVEPIVQSYQDDGRPVQLISYGAGSISRGILDAAREHRADLILFGGRETSGRGVNFSTVAENVLPAAPCYVVLFRIGATHADRRLVVPIVAGEQSRAAAQLAIRLGRSMDRPVEAIYVRTGRTTNWDARGQIESALVGIAGQEDVKRTIAQSQDAVSGLLSRIEDDVMVVVGVSDRSEWQRWLRADLPMALIRRWRGPLLMVSPTSAPLTRGDRIRRWLSPTLTQFEQVEIEREAEASATTSLDYLVLIVVAAVLATFGLMLNSNAVIIGAMLVAPLMSPLIAFAVGMTLGKLDLVWRATIVLVQGIAGALLISFLIGWLSPTTIVTTEMASRGNPSLLDMGVALASGFIGAYATARKHIPSALAGVAIAAALMPPLATVGLGLAFGDFGLASGAALLFVTNIISIILAAWATFFWFGMRPSKKVDARRTRRTSAILVAIFVLVLAALLAQNANTIFSATIERTLRDSFNQSELVGYEVRQGTPLQVFATVRMPASVIPDTSEIIAAQNNLEEALGEPVELSVVIQPVVDASVAEADAEVEATIGRILNEELTDMTVLGFKFAIGNPTLVLAAVQTELAYGSEEFNEQVGASEAALAQELGLPVVLSILPLETYDSTEAVDATDQALSEAIEEVLIESLTCCEIVSFSFQVGNPFLVTVTVMTDMDPASDEFLAQVRATEDALSDALGWPVKLTVIVTQPSPTPTATETPFLPSATPTFTPTEEIQSPEPPTEEPPTEEPPTPTSEPPTATAEPPTEEPPTEEPPTPTSGPPTSTVEPPTEEPPTPQPTGPPTEELPTATSPPPTATPEATLTVPTPTP